MDFEQPLILPLAPDTFDAFLRGECVEVLARPSGAFRKNHCRPGRSVEAFSRSGGANRARGVVREFSLRPLYELPMEAASSVLAAYGKLPFVACLKIAAIEAAPGRGQA
jgi:hypothetical protein